MTRLLFRVFALTLILSTATIRPASPQSDSTKASSTKKAAAAKPASDTPAVSLAVISVNGVNDIDPTKAAGSKTATVTMEIFSDYQCPACKQLFTTTTQKVVDNYVNTGKIFLVHRDFPLPMHAYSRIAASYVRAAAHIGKNDVVESAVFNSQAKWEADGKVQEAVASVLTPAEMKRVQSLVDSKVLEPLIEKDKSLGQGYAVNQTPTSWLHTKSGQSFPVVGFVQYDVLKTFLDELVAQK